VAASGVDDMSSRSESSRNVIRVNATSIDVTSSTTITFGYVNELARAGRVIGGRYRLHSPLFGTSARARRPAPRFTPECSITPSILWRADSLERLGSPVLIELLDPAIAEDPGLADVFVAEARAAAAVSSPFVSRVLDFGIEGSTPYLVTELGVGETLAARIAARQRPSAGELARIFSELASAVGAMHAVGLLHRDLRGERVHLWRAPMPKSGERESVKLAFGISKLMNDTLELARTMARRAVTPAVSPHYASPEQVLGTLPMVPASDLWSLAVIAFECMTGELPFVGATMGERLVQICAGSARVPSEVCKVPRGFDQWFARGVCKAPTARWGSAQEMASALRAILVPRAPISSAR
jgi:serine/threonine protein kinase